MTENINYRKCVCDICGKEEHISQSAILPKEWEHFKFGQKSFDVCLDCFIKVDMAVEDLKDSYLRGKNMNNLVWYRFKTKAVDDYRPLIDMADIQMPWWCTGSAMDDSYVIIVCYLPKGEDLLKYWDDAYDIDSEEISEITYNSRFCKPEWIKE